MPSRWRSPSGRCCSDGIEYGGCHSDAANSPARTAQGGCLPRADSHAVDSLDILDRRARESSGVRVTSRVPKRIDVAPGRPPVVFRKRGNLHSRANMSRLNQLDGRFDAVIVGGGIIGAGIARDAALRGLRVAVLDRADFGGATTAASTRLIHGGLRYLQTLDLRLVRLDLRERETLLRIAPHLVKPLPFFLPFYDATILNRLTLRAGMALYEALSYDKSLPPHRILNAREAAELEPALRPEGLSGGAMYYDAQVSSPERLTLENILEARELGAVALNYADVSGAFRQDGGDRRRRGDRSTPGERARIHSRVVINASGPWFDRVAATLSPHPKPEVRTTKGIHVACHALDPPGGAALLEDRWPRLLCHPVAGHTWLGTTDTDYEEDPAVATATADDVRYLLQSARDYIPAIDQAQAYWTCAGIRALVKRGGPGSATSRLHRIRETVTRSDFDRRRQDHGG